MRVGRVAVLALAAALVLSLADAMVKWLVRDYPVVMIAWSRMALVTLFLFVTNVRSLGWRLLTPVAWRLQIARGAAAVLGNGMFLLGVRYMPLAECTAVIFLAPVLANVFSMWMLGERGDRLSWLVAVVSFVGVVLIARPGSALFTPAIVFPLAGSIGLAAFMTLTRAVARDDDPRVTAFFGPMVAACLLALVLPLTWAWPQSWFDGALMVAIGLLAAVAQVLQTLAYREGTTHQVAPFSYSSLVFAILMGWAVFGDVPDAIVWAGMLLIGLGGVVLMLRR